MFVEFEEGGGLFELAAFEVLPVGLDVTQCDKRFLELAGEAGGLAVEAGEEVVGFDDRKAVCAGDEAGFKKRDAAQAPGGVAEFFDELGFGGRGRLVFVEEGATVGFEGGGVFGGENRRRGGKPVA